MFISSGKNRLSDEVALQITEMIRSGEYVPGDRLPSSQQLSQQLEVSRTVVREALSRLETLGLIETQQSQGTYVKDPTREVLQTALVPHIFTSQETIHKLFELREIIEVQAAGLAAARATEADIAAMRRWVEAVEFHVAQEDRGRHITADTQFHRQIIIATGNDVLVDLVESITHLLRDMRFAGVRIPELRSKTIISHRAILAAIEAGDSQLARQAMQEHLDSVRETIEAFWAKQSAVESEKSSSASAQ